MTASLVVLSLASAGCGDDPTAPGGRDYDRSLVVQGQVRRYLLHVPGSYRPQRPAPLLVLLHGANDSPIGFQERIGLDPFAESAGFVTVYPEGFGSSWTSDDVPFVRALIAHVADSLAIDPSRMYAAGMSRGGLLAHLLACELASELAAVVSVAATMTFETASSCRPSRPLPILFVHGTEDPQFLWHRGQGLLSLPASVAWWVRNDSCSSEPMISWLPDRANDGTRVWRETYAGCAGAATVMLYGIEGGGHTWPGAPGPFPASLGRITREMSSGEIIAFLRAHHLTP